ncbi:MAG: TlpA family protein disulfide reductase [Bryobacteraceae bacterium]|nr:TlpA family protein disulfide reductase [Bryobacteraceae bacterium]
MRALFALCLLSLPLAAQTTPQQPNLCDPEPAAFAALFDFNDQRSVPVAERLAAADQLAERFPNDYAIQIRRLGLHRWRAPERWPAHRDALVARATKNPKDPLALILAATALHQFDTPRAITLAEKALEVSPGNPWALLLLAGIRQSGKFADAAKARESFAAYVKACPGRLLSDAEWTMGKIATPEMQIAFARDLRARLAEEKDPRRLQDYPILWGIEFRARPPQEHPEVRKQVAADLARLRALENPKPTAAWWRLLLGATRQSGASREAIAAMEDQILAAAPDSEPAYSITYERWKKANPEPTDQKNREAWESWNAKQIEALNSWVKQFKDVPWLPGQLLNARIAVKQVTEKEALAQVRQQFHRDHALGGPSLWNYVQSANVLLDQGWAPQQALLWMREAWPLAVDEDQRVRSDDTRTAAQLAEFEEEGGARSVAAQFFLRAAVAARSGEIPESLRQYVESCPEPKNKGRVSDHYWLRARLAAADRKPAESLALFQQALFRRERAPQHYRGELRDRLLEESRAQFLESGGSEKTFALWSKPPEGSGAQLADGRWEKPTKAMPSFELTDLSGKSWKLKQLEGKSVLINLWATWCGPCRAEMPHFQKLYEKLKDKSDVQVLSFNVDDELGLVEPYVKEHGYTFPVLAAYSLVRGLFDGYAIPQNWLLGPKGEWLAMQIGFDASDAEWVATMTRHLERARTGVSPIAP